MLISLVSYFVTYFDEYELAKQENKFWKHIVPNVNILLNSSKWQMAPVICHINTNKTWYWQEYRLSNMLLHKINT